MGKPQAIIWFERLWWASTLTWLLGVWTTWRQVQSAIDGNPAAAPAAMWAQPALTALVLIVSVVLWWLVARRASVVGKWLVAIVALLTTLRGLAALVNFLGGFVHPVTGIASIVTVVLTIAASVMLFRGDAASWFGIAHDDDDGDGDVEHVA